MFSDHSAPRIPLKVVINKQKTKVLFAEANTDFINVLLSFLALPLGKAVAELGYNKFSDVLGSLKILQLCLSHMDETIFCVGCCKDMLRYPLTSLRAECRKLALDLTDSPPNKYYVCLDNYCSKSHMNVSMFYDRSAKCDCGGSLKKEILFEECLDGEAFVSHPSSFIITNDLRVVPVLTGVLQTLTNLGITDIQGAEIRSVIFRRKDICELLKFSLTSATPLTDMIIKNDTQMGSSAAKPEPDQILLHHIPKNSLHTRKMVLKAYLQKSTNKFLFAEATGEFVEMLFSFLTIPLGGVEFLFGGNNCMKSIDNLYRSVSNDIDDECFATADTKNRLINPKLPHGYASKNQFLPLGEDSPPKLYYTVGNHGLTTFHEKDGTLVSSFKSRLSSNEYVKKQRMCIVSDDLTVNPSLAASISILNGVGVPLSDVKETELQVGLEEALCILKASLTSKTALTDALIKPMLKKPKQEL